MSIWPKYPLSFVYADAEAGDGSLDVDAVAAFAATGTGAGVGADATAFAGTASGAAFFRNLWGRPPGNLMRAGTPITIMFERTSVRTKLLAAITTLLPILASPTNLAPGPK